MKSFLLILFVSLSQAYMVHSQPVVYINAGSRSVWGTTQELMINTSGKCNYYLKEVNGVGKDSSVFNISISRLDSLFNKANQSGFFNLNPRYDGKLSDGAGIYISLNNAGRKHSVHLFNTDLPAINELISWLNNVLAALGIKINYGQVPSK